MKLYQYQYTDDKNQAHTITFDSLDEGLSKISDPVKRKEFAMNVKLNQDGSIDTSNSTGIKQIQSVCYQTDGPSTGESADYPLSYGNYQEKYFLTQEEKDSKLWKEIEQFIDPTTDKPITYTVKINGTIRKIQPEPVTILRRNSSIIRFVKRQMTQIQGMQIIQMPSTEKIFRILLC